MTSHSLMNYRRMFRLAAQLIALGAMNALMGGEASGTIRQTSSVEALLSEAVRNNLELKKFQAELAVAKGERREAGAWSNPELDASLGRKSVQEGGMNSEGTEYSLSLKQSFEWPGRIGLRKAIADGDIALAELHLRHFEAELAASIRSGAFGLSAARKRSLAAKEVADRLTALRDMLVRRDPRGPVALLETRIIEAAEMALRRKAGLAAKGERDARRTLNQLRGAEADADAPFLSVEVEFLAPEPLEELLWRARENSFEIRLAKSELAQTELRLRLAKNDRFPALSLGPAYEESLLEQERMAALEVSLPLALWNRNRGAVEAFEARLVQARNSLSHVDREITATLGESYRFYADRLHDLSRWRLDSLRHFREAAEMADRRFRLGAVPIAVFVEMQEKYVEAVEAYLEAQRDALGAALTLETLTLQEKPLATVWVKGEKP